MLDCSINGESEQPVNATATADPASAVARCEGLSTKLCRQRMPSAPGKTALSEIPEMAVGFRLRLRHFGLSNSYDASRIA
jgi:hypothetical protein